MEKHPLCTNCTNQKLTALYTNKKSRSFALSIQPQANPIYASEVNVGDKGYVFPSLPLADAFKLAFDVGGGDMFQSTCDGVVSVTAAFG